MLKRIRWMAWRTFPVLLVALVIAACSDGLTPAGQLTAPDQAELARKTTTEQQRGKKLRTVVAGNTGRTWKLVSGRMPDTTTVKDEQIIGPAGGMLRSAGHVLYVPEGAVAQPTKFKITASKTPVDATVSPDSQEVFVQVQLKAYTVDAAGNALVDVGALGFLKPVYLGLSYSWVQDVVTDPSRAAVLWMKSATEVEETRTFSVDYNGKWVVSELNHFSIYTMAIE